MNGCVQKCLHCAIRFHTGIANCKEQFGVDPFCNNWMETVCGSPKEEIDPNAPPPNGKPVHLFSFTDANLMHDLPAVCWSLSIKLPLIGSASNKVKSKLQPTVPSSWHMIFDQCCVLCSLVFPQWSIVDD